MGVPIDPGSLYGASQNTSNSSGEIGDHDATGQMEAMVSEPVSVDEADLGGVAQLSVVEAMLRMGKGKEAGLNGVAMTRYSIQNHAFFADLLVIT